MKQTIKLYTYKKSGDLDYTYKPLHNMYTSVSDYSLKDFITTNLHYSPDNPVTIDCQESYDGSINLLITDDNDTPRIINSAFTVQENNKYERVTRNQLMTTNHYLDATVDSTTRLQRSLSSDSGFLNIALENIEEGGQMMGGNYIFMIKYCDEDNNETSIISESGVVSVFKGTLPSNAEGTIANETTNKTVVLKLTNLDPAYNKFKIVYKRSFCDLTGTLDYEFKEFKSPYKITQKEDGSMLVYILGSEPTVDVTYDSIITQPNIYNKARTEAQVQNTLFLGNVDEQVEQQVLLQKLSYLIPVTAVKENTVKKGWFSHKTGDGELMEYTNPKNIYYSLGYMPGEIYRLGIVYIYNNDSTSAVYNLQGDQLNFNEPSITDIPEDLPEDFSLDFDMTETFISDCKNTKGVFIMPNDTWVESSINYTPIGLRFNVSEAIIAKLKSIGIKGYYFVRQKRIPNFIAQGFSIGVSKKAYIPMLPNNDGYFTHGLVKTTSVDDKCQAVLQQYLSLLTVKNDDVDCIGLMCVDAYLNMNLQSLLSGSVFTLMKVGEYQAPFGQYDRYIRITRSSTEGIPVKGSLIYIPENTSSRIYNNKIFSTKAGAAEELKSIRSLTWDSTTDSESQTMDENLVRGNYTSYIGVISPSGDDTFSLEHKSIYNIYIDYCESPEEWRKAINKRVYDKSEYTAISDRINISDIDVAQEHLLYRGDCFTGEVSTKFQWNFLDYNTPLNTTIVKPEFDWPVNDEDSNPTYSNTKWEDLNVSDWNAVPIGYNVTYRYISNFNLSLRCINSHHVDEKALFGSDRTFYPLTAYTNSTAWKLPESSLLNEGLNTTMTCLPNFEVELVPYIKHTFDNRIAFSEMQQQGGFQNGYRIFKGLQYQDLDNSYGAIVKLIPYGANLFCVFEHGCGIVPVNEKALIQTTTSQSVHMYGAGVLQSQVTVVSQDYGSTHEDSVIVTPGGIYGVDAEAKKIWKFSANQFTLISDQYVQRFLNDNLSDPIKDTWVGFKNIKTHYNNYKGDVMFTFYNDDKCWNLCYNERINKFVTKYSWTPVLSDNIQNSFISINKEPSTIYSLIVHNSKSEKGLIIDKNSAFYGELPICTIAKPATTKEITNVRINSITYPVLENEVVVYKSISADKVVYMYENDSMDEISIENEDLSIHIDIDNTWTIRTTAINDFYTTWIQIDLSITYNYSDDCVNQIICMAAKTDPNKPLDEYKRKLYEKTLVSKIYTHGFAGNHKELNYLDSNPDNQLKPTYWYDKQEPFEFEFVVNTPTGIQKIFNNLSIISNNAEPQSLEISLIGDSYNFNKANIYKSEHFVEPKFKDGVFDENQYNIDKQDLEFNNTEYSQDFVNMNGIQYETSIDFDPILNQYYLKVKDDCRNIKDSRYGRRLGNIEYKEDKWNLTLTPIYYKQKELKNGEIAESKINSTRIRDKWIKVRIKYTGEKLVVISAILTLMTLSFA